MSLYYGFDNISKLKLLPKESSPASFSYEGASGLREMIRSCAKFSVSKLAPLPSVIVGCCPWFFPAMKERDRDSSFVRERAVNRGATKVVVAPTLPPSLRILLLTPVARTASPINPILETEQPADNPKPRIA